MRRFRFVGDTNAGWCMPVEVGRVYENDYFINGKGDSLISDTDLDDWEEVFDEPKKLHKDTDLGYFAGLALQAFLSNPHEDFVMMELDAIIDYSVDSAKKLIKALDKEVSNE